MLGGSCPVPGCTFQVRDIPGMDLRQGRRSHTTNPRHWSHEGRRGKDTGNLLCTSTVGHCKLGARHGRFDCACPRSCGQNGDHTAERRIAVADRARSPLVGQPDTRHRSRCYQPYRYLVTMRCQYLQSLTADSQNIRHPAESKARRRHASQFAVQVMLTWGHPGAKCGQERRNCMIVQCRNPRLPAPTGTETESRSLSPLSGLN